MKYSMEYGIAVFGVVVMFLGVVATVRWDRLGLFLMVTGMSTVGMAALLAIDAIGIGAATMAALCFGCALALIIVDGRSPRDLPIRSEEDEDAR